MAISDLRTQANQIKNEVNDNLNTATRVGTVLVNIIDQIAADPAFKGIATPSSSPDLSDGKKSLYIAREPGTYTNFGNKTVAPGEIRLLSHNGTSWSSSVLFSQNDLLVDDEPTAGSAKLVKSGGVHGQISPLAKKVDGIVYDVSKENDGATFASLSALLSDANLSTLIPAGIRTGGMSIRFVCSSDNRYVQYTYLRDTVLGSNDPFQKDRNWGYIGETFPISMNQSIRRIIKELYVSSTIADYSQITKIRILKAYYDANSEEYRCGVILLNENTQLVSAGASFSTEADALAFCDNRMFNSNGLYCIVDWDKVEKGVVNVYDVALMTRYINDVDFMPKISEYIDRVSILSDISTINTTLNNIPNLYVGKVDIAYRTGTNLANPANIIPNSNVNNSGVFKTNVEGWATIVITVEAGKTYTFGRCSLGRRVPGAFYQGSNTSTPLLQIAYDDDDMVIGKTVTAPENADRLYLAIQTTVAEPDYSQFTCVEGTILLPYAPYEIFVDKVMNRRIWAANADNTAKTDLSTLIVDLPVSDGTTIGSGYAYIDSVDRSVKVKQ